jgi:hypothetical protein
MSEQDERSTGAVRRFGRKDSKRRLDPRGPLIPPDWDDDAETVLGETVQPLPAPVAPPQPDAPAPRVVHADRFPPLAPPSESAPPPRSLPADAPRRRSPCLYNLLTLLFLLATVAAIALVAIITVNPYSALNPFPPFTPLPVFITTTPLPATATDLPTPEPTATFTPLPLEALATATPAFPFSVANDGALFIPNTNSEGCNWSSIAGSVTEANGAGLNGYGVRITGGSVDETVFSGAAPTFGPGGFELFLNGVPLEQTYTVQLLDASGLPAAPAVSVTTRTSCEQNVAILSFVATGG